MKRVLVSAVVFGIVGLVVGYLIFGRVAGEYIPIQTIFRLPENMIGSMAQNITGVSDARQSICMTGAVGLCLVVVASSAGRRRRYRSIHERVGETQTIPKSLAASARTASAFPPSTSLVSTLPN